ncbi:MAG TPA: dihydrolipoamide acetyltransferase family protein [Bosea sp. (in: a-proteobacteria)]|jgi:pyruvate dehydrogenase E2 component (dihydrolipoamide acetyltransferase)|uniref:dihydrolipoamide acetyltransferase family protein n=1 Tax=Bosea sp. (in: a-proteobacteria) TaxID=1871050 RepID=UPI002E153C73|nr:dihydrolipoamide acetyltransferase family protein [Bosea sp. (in: a-proteobacteria)]
MSASAAIVMPKLGLTMTEGLLASWRVGAGDTVATGDVLFVIETEKIATEIEAERAGRIGTILVPEGETVPVGATLATWADGKAAPAMGTTPAAEVRPQPAPAADRTAEPARVGMGTRLIATPLARRVARQNGIALDRVAGSGPHGRIKLKDVEAALATAPPASAAPLRKTDSQRRPATPIEQVVARRLSQAKQTIPHFYVMAEADITGLLAMREELNAAGLPQRLSITHFIMAAVGRALLAQPEINAVWDEGDIVTLAGSDVGIAVDSPRGLMVPVLRDAGARHLDAVASSCAGLVVRARDGRLTAADCEGGAISVSNVGMYGASHLVSIINPGQSAILGVAAVKPVFRPDAQGQPTLRQELGLVLSCDHRVIDGVRAARFLDLVVKTLEHPLPLLRQPAPQGSQT